MQHCVGQFEQYFLQSLKIWHVIGLIENATISEDFAADKPESRIRYTLPPHHMKDTSSPWLGTRQTSHAHIF
jgi:hypothetical protein